MQIAWCQAIGKLCPLITQKHSTTYKKGRKHRETTAKKSKKNIMTEAMALKSFNELELN